MAWCPSYEAHGELCIVSGGCTPSLQHMRMHQAVDVHLSAGAAWVYDKTYSVSNYPSELLVVSWRRQDMYMRIYNSAPKAPAKLCPSVHSSTISPWRTSAIVNASQSAATPALDRPATLNGTGTLNNDSAIADHFLTTLTRKIFSAPGEEGGGSGTRKKSQREIPAGR